MIPPALPESHVLGNKRHDVDGIPDFVKKSIRKQGHKSAAEQIGSVRLRYEVYEEFTHVLGSETTR
jgi:hypothetical protein